MTISCLVFQDPPVDFLPRVEAAGCYCEHEKRFLILRRSLHSPQGNTWGIPAGKLEPGEKPLQAAVRELYEETGIAVNPQNLEHVGQLYVRHPGLDFIFHLYRTSFGAEPSLTLDEKEHLEARWVTVEEALRLPLIAGGADTIHYYVKHKNSKSSRKQMPRSSFYYVRHGECDFQNRHYSDEEDMHFPLNDNGHRQAHSIKPLIEQLPIKTVCISPMKRAKQTFEIIAGSLNCHKVVIDDLRECNLATWLQMTQEPFDHRGELVQHFFERALRGVSRALEYPGPVLIVAHGGIHWAISHLLGVDHEKKIPNCVPVHFHVENIDGWKAKILAKPH